MEISLSRLLAAVWLCGFAACRSGSENPSSMRVASAPTVIVHAAAGSAASASAPGDAGLPDAEPERPKPIEGFEFFLPDRGPNERHATRVNAEGTLVAMWRSLYAGHEGTEYTLLTRTVDDDREVGRFVIENRSGDCDRNLSLEKCREFVEKSRAKAKAFIARDEWAELRRFHLYPYETACGELEETRLRWLRFKTFQITYSKLVVRVLSASGEVLLEKKLPSWHPMPKSEPVAAPEDHHVEFVGLDLKRRVLLVELEYCYLLNIGFDKDTRFHAIRLPPMEALGVKP